MGKVPRDNGKKQSFKDSLRLESIAETSTGKSTKELVNVTEGRSQNNEKTKTDDINIKVDQHNLRI